MRYWPYSTIVIALLLLNMNFPIVSHASELQAAPWARPPDAPQPLSPEEMDFNTEDETGLEKMSVLAEQGRIIPTVLLAMHYQETGDFKQAIRWRRHAVKLGHVPSSLVLANLYFPMRGSLGREKLPIPPNIVIAACWHAIALAGNSTSTSEISTQWLEQDGAPDRETLDALESLMLPFEKAQAKAILAAWPDSLPPEGSSKSLDSENAEPTPAMSVEAFIPLLYDYLGGKRDYRETFRALADENFLKAVVVSLQDKAATGDAHAQYSVAWFHLMGVGTEQEKQQALDYIRGKAEHGEAKACVHLAQHYMESEDLAEEAAQLYRLAAEQGRADAMLGLALCLGQNGDKKAESQWLEKAAGAGNIQALMGLVELAERAQDAAGLVKWLSILSLRHPDPHAAYRARVMLGFFIEGMAAEEMADALRNAEEWHTSHHR